MTSANRQELKRRLAQIAPNVKGIRTGAPVNWITIKGDFVTDIRLSDGTKFEVYLVHDGMETSRCLLDRVTGKGYYY